MDNIKNEFPIIESYRNAAEKNMEFSIIEVDGKEIDSEQFWKILSTYEGLEISLVIKEQ